MFNSINDDEYTFIVDDITDDNTTTTVFYDIITRRPLFVNLPPSIVVPNIEELKLLIPDISKTNVSISEEGTTLRVFHNRGVWYTATKRKLQAFKSSWADKTVSFGASFAQAVRNEIDAVDDPRDDREFLEYFYENFLDKDKVYFFLLRNTAGERIVCNPPPNTKALHICTQINGVNDFKVHLNTDIGPFTHTTTVNPTYEDIEGTMAVLNFKEHQGIIVEYNSVFYKILLPEYAKLANIRGSTASLKMCYLKLRSSEHSEDRQIFLNLYPEFGQFVEQLETNIYLICCRLHKIYMDKFILKKQVTLNLTDSNAMKIIHRGYVTSRQATTPKRINDLLVSHPGLVNHLLKEKVRYEKQLHRSKN